MSDLISRSKAISILKQLNEHSLTGKMDISNAIYLLEIQPTAYDVDEVVKSLKEWTFNAYVNIGDGTIMNHNLIASKNAIEIVKQGGVSDDVCEWNFVSGGEFIQNPHTKRLYSNEPSMKNIYCNTCGKKIKEVD